MNRVHDCCSWEQRSLCYAQAPSCARQRLVGGFQRDSFRRLRRGGVARDQPADFHVERFTMGNYISVGRLTSRLVQRHGDSPGLRAADLAIWHGCVADLGQAPLLDPYLPGVECDRARVTLVSDGDTATVRIPGLELPAAPADASALAAPADPATSAEPILTADAWNTPARRMRQRSAGAAGDRTRAG